MEDVRPVRVNRLISGPVTLGQIEVPARTKDAKREWTFVYDGETPLASFAAGETKTSTLALRGVHCAGPLRVCGDFDLRICDENCVELISRAGGDAKPWYSREALLGAHRRLQEAADHVIVCWTHERGAATFEGAMASFVARLRDELQRVDVGATLYSGNEKTHEERWAATGFPFKWREKDRAYVLDHPTRWAIKPTVQEVDAWIAEQTKGT